MYLKGGVYIYGRLNDNITKTHNLNIHRYNMDWPCSVVTMLFLLPVKLMILLTSLQAIKKLEANLVSRSRLKVV